MTTEITGVWVTTEITGVWEYSLKIEGVGVVSYMVWTLRVRDLDIVRYRN